MSRTCGRPSRTPSRPWMRVAAPTDLAGVVPGQGFVLHLRDDVTGEVQARPVVAWCIGTGRTAEPLVQFEEGGAVLAVPERIPGVQFRVMPAGAVPVWPESPN